MGLKSIWQRCGDTLYIVSQIAAVTVRSGSPATLQDSVQGGRKMASFLYTLTSPHVNRYSKLFHWHHQEKICNNTTTKVPTAPQVCCYIAL